jgi:hypothetical protein
MSEKQNEDSTNNNSKKNGSRSSSPNPFLNYLSSSPSRISPRSEMNSPRSPRMDGSAISNAMLTAGIFLND